MFTSQASEDGQAAVRARVKWFNGSKGFGFVAPMDGAPDAFLHATALRQAGVEAVTEGAEVLCLIGAGPKGPQVIQVHQVSEPAELGVTELGGEVKWYQPEKGFGFVVADDGGRDVFVHKSVLRRCQVEELDQRDRVRVRFTETPKGREAVWITVG